jgi:hypothetical protein
MQTTTSCRAGLHCQFSFICRAAALILNCKPRSKHSSSPEGKVAQPSKPPLRLAEYRFKSSAVPCLRAVLTVASVCVPGPKEYHAACRQKAINRGKKKSTAAGKAGYWRVQLLVRPAEDFGVNAVDSGSPCFAYNGSHSNAHELSPSLVTLLVVTRLNWKCGANASFRTFICASTIV